MPITVHATQWPLAPECSPSEAQWAEIDAREQGAGGWMSHGLKVSGKPGSHVLSF